MIYFPLIPNINLYLLQVALQNINSGLGYHKVVHYINNCLIQETQHFRKYGSYLENTEYPQNSRPITLHPSTNRKQPDIATSYLPIVQESFTFLTTRHYKSRIPDRQLNNPTLNSRTYPKSIRQSTCNIHLIVIALRVPSPHSLKQSYFIL